MGTARMKSTKKQKNKVKREAHKKSDGLSLANKNTILIKIIWYYFMRYGKFPMKYNQHKIKKKQIRKIILPHHHRFHNMETMEIIVTRKWKRKWKSLQR